MKYKHSLSDIKTKAIKWAQAKEAPPLAQEFYCPTRDVFQARLGTLLSHLEKNFGNDAYLLAAVTGEIGNNSFDHNLGNWPDVPGVLFATDETSRGIILADRGQGIMTTIRNAVPNAKTHKAALSIAFTRIISGRGGERRGNGLKFVAKIITEKRWSLRLYSGDALAHLKDGQKLTVTASKLRFPGCFAIMNY